jgi:hypothetical protein
LKNKGILNKKYKPAAIKHLLALGTANIIRYLNKILLNYLSFFRCVDDFNYFKRRLYWYFKFSLVSTLKAKFKLGSKTEVFEKYTQDLKCLDEKSKEICFVSAAFVNSLKRNYFINKPVEKLDLCRT